MATHLRKERGLHTYTFLHAPRHILEYIRRTFELLYQYIGALILLAVKLLLPFILHLPLVEAFILLFGQPLFSYSVQLRLAQVESV